MWPFSGLRSLWGGGDGTSDGNGDGSNEGGSAGGAGDGGSVGGGERGGREAPRRLGDDWTSLIQSPSPAPSLQFELPKFKRRLIQCGVPIIFTAHFATFPSFSIEYMELVEGIPEDPVAQAVGQLYFDVALVDQRGVGTPRPPAETHVVHSPVLCVDYCIKDGAQSLITMRITFLRPPGELFVLSQGQDLDDAAPIPMIQLRMSARVRVNNRVETFASSALPIPLIFSGKRSGNRRSSSNRPPRHFSLPSVPASSHPSPPPSPSPSPSPSSSSSPSHSLSQSSQSSPARVVSLVSSPRPRPQVNGGNGRERGMVGRELVESALSRNQTSTDLLFGFSWPHQQSASALPLSLEIRVNGAEEPGRERVLTWKQRDTESEFIFVLLPPGKHLVCILEGKERRLPLFSDPIVEKNGDKYHMLEVLPRLQHTRPLFQTATDIPPPSLYSLLFDYRIGDTGEGFISRGLPELVHIVAVSPRNNSTATFILQLIQRSIAHIRRKAQFPYSLGSVGDGAARGGDEEEDSGVIEDKNAGRSTPRGGSTQMGASVFEAEPLLLLGPTTPVVASLAPPLAPSLGVTESGYTSLVRWQKSLKLTSIVRGWVLLLVLDYDSPPSDYKLALKFLLEYRRGEPSNAGSHFTVVINDVPSQTINEHPNYPSAPPLFLQLTELIPRPYLFLLPSPPSPSATSAFFSSPSSSPSPSLRQPSTAPSTARTRPERIRAEVELYTQTLFLALVNLLQQSERRFWAIQQQG